MSLIVTFNGSNYIIPTTNEVGWGSNLDAYFVAIAAGCLQKTGGLFTLSAETDFGASFGLKSLYYKSRTANIASTGILRLANLSDTISWRNAANSADLPLTVNGSNQLTFNGVPIGGSGIFTASRAVITDGSGNLTTATTTSTEIGFVSGVTSAIQTQLNAKKTIATGNAFKFETTDTSGNLQETTVTASRAVATDANGLPTASATTATELGFVSGVTSAIQTQLNAKATDSLVVHLAGTETITGNKSLNVSSGVALNFLNQSAIAFSDSGNAHELTFFAPSSLSTNVTYLLPASPPAINGATMTGTTGGTMSWTSLLPVANGGTGLGTLAAHGVLIGNGTSALTISGAGSSGQVLTSNGASADPTFQNVAGTGTVNSGTQYQLAYYATSTNAVSGASFITTNAANQLLVTNSTGIGTTSPNLGSGAIALTLSAGTSGVHVPVFELQGTRTTNNSDFAEIDFYHQTTRVAGIFALRGTADDEGYLEFLTKTTGGSLTLGLILDAAQHALFADGSAANPSISLINAATTGLYKAGTNQLGIATNGTVAITIDASQKAIHNGNIAFTTTSTQGIVGTTTNDSAAAGNVGETVNSALGTSTISFPTSTQWGDLTSISLTAGDWLVSGTLMSSVNASTYTAIGVGISTTTGNFATGLNSGDNELFMTNLSSPTNFSLAIPSYRMSLSGTTTVYLKMQATYSAGTPKVTGRISAVRIR